jgi:hypothetical protein
MSSSRGTCSTPFQATPVGEGYDRLSEPTSLMIACACCDWNVISRAKPCIPVVTNPKSTLDESAPTDPIEGQTFEVDEIYQNAGKKGGPIAIRMTHPAAARISNRGMARMTTTARRSFISSAARRARSAAHWSGTVTRRRVMVFWPKRFHRNR